MNGTEQRLTWALVIATKDRLPVLRHCVRLALAQSRPPAEVIIVDASADWEAHKSEIGTVLAAHPQIRSVYKQAPKPSSCVQRNCGLDAATGDIVFIIDDDSFLYPDAAEAVMHVYESDTAQAIAAVALAGRNTPPDGDLPEAAMRPANKDLRFGTTGRLRRVLGYVLLTGLRHWFIPYDKRYPRKPLPPHLDEARTRRISLMDGYRVTCRRKIAVKHKFDPLFLFYCPGEDLDFCYRVSRDGALVEARNAKVFHFGSGANRLRQYQVALLATLNQAVFLRKNAADQTWARGRYVRRVLHRVFADGIKDVLTRSWDLPTARGTWAALRLSGRVFRSSLEEIAGFYPGMQTQIVKGERPL